MLPSLRPSSRSLDSRQTLFPVSNNPSNGYNVCRLPCYRFQIGDRIGVFGDLELLFVLTDVSKDAPVTR